MKKMLAGLAIAVSVLGVPTAAWRKVKSRVGRTVEL